MAASSLALFSLCIAVHIFSGFANKLFLNIDCGVPTGTRTNGLQLKWVGDGGYIKTGKTAQVTVTNRYGQEDQTLRYFPSQKKSCYVIPGVARGRKHMIRASFFYGNYDGKSFPPSFDLQFDGNNWDSVRTSSTIPYYREVIYGPKRDSISVCVAQTSPDQIPFISFLQIRELETDMYETNEAEDVLLKLARTAFGATDLVRYPADPYDRYWHPPSYKIEGLTTVTRDNMSSIPKFTEMPGLALAHAITPASNNETTLTVPSSKMRLVDDLYYYNFYFMEVSQLAYQNKSRSFDFLVDGIKRNTLPIVPPYQGNWTVYDHGLRLNAGSVISLKNTLDATLPPILNAIELFTVRKKGLTNGTNENDGLSLSSLSYGISASDRSHEALYELS